MVDLGMKPIDALKAGTSSDAELLGIADRSRARWKRTSWPTWSRSPAIRWRTFAQTEHVFFVMKEGVVYKNDRAAAESAQTLLCSASPRAYSARLAYSICLCDWIWKGGRTMPDLSRHGESQASRTTLRKSAHQAAQVGRPALRRTILDEIPSPTATTSAIWCCISPAI